MTVHRALIVGAGGWSRMWGRALVNCDRARLVGWVDIRPGQAELAVQAVGAGKVYTSTNLDKALTSTQADFVINATLPSAHCEVTIQALEAGLPVVCEKPMAETMEQAWRMVAASERAGKLLMISHQRTHDPRLAAMKRLIVDEVGPLGMLDCDFYHGHPELNYHPGMRGALLFDMAIHSFDAARYVSGTDPVAVYCHDFNPAWSWHSSNAAALAVFEMTKGLRFSYRGTWASQGWDTTWESRWRAVGPHGTVVWDGEGIPEAELVAHPGSFPPEMRRELARVDDTEATGVTASLQHFIEAIDTGIAPIGECHDSVRSFAMVMGAVESAISGQRVSIEPLLQPPAS